MFCVVEIGHHCYEQGDLLLKLQQEVYGLHHPPEQQIKTVKKCMAVIFKVTNGYIHKIMNLSIGYLKNNCLKLSPLEEECQAH